MLVAVIMGVQDCGAHRGDGLAIEIIATRPFMRYATVPCEYVSKGAAASCSECAKKIAAAVLEFQGAKP